MSNEKKDQRMNNFNVIFSCKFYLITVLFIALQLCSLMTRGCLSSGGSGGNQAQISRSGRNSFSQSSTSHTTTSFASSRNTIKRRYLTLNKGVAFQSTTHIHTEDGQPIYGRIIVPFSFGEPNTLTITAKWHEDYITSPLWMFLKAGSSLPSNRIFDKQSISFTSRKYARIRKDFISPGEYTLLIEPLQNMDGITINISILPMTHEGAGNSHWRPDPNKEEDSLHVNKRTINIP